MKTTTIIDVFGCVPYIGSAIGIGRISIALNKAYNETLNKPFNDGFCQSIFESLKADQNKGFEEIFHGACEIIPIKGPILYGTIKLLCLIARKVNEQWEACNNKRNIPKQPISKPVENIHKIKGVKCVEDLRQFIGKTIEITVTRYAHSDFQNDYRDLHGCLTNKIIRGKLLKISDGFDTYIGNTKRYCFTLEELRTNNEKASDTYYMSDREVECLNG